MAESGPAERVGLELRALPTVRGMTDRTFAVTLVKVGRGLPHFEVGAYRYTAEWLPQVGDTIEIRRVTTDDADPPEELRGYVTRVNPTSDAPISVVEVETSELVTTDEILA
jgi:hypothetical protein